MQSLFTRIIFLCLAGICLLFLSCSPGDSLQATDAYFQGLDALTRDDTVTAIKAFTESKNMQSNPASLFAIEELLPLLYAGEYYEDILAITQTLNFDNSIKNTYTLDPNMLTRYRLLSMIHTAGTDTFEDITDQLHTTAFSKEHLLFFTDDVFIDFAENHREDFFYEHIEIQTAVYNRNYARAVNIVETIDFAQNIQNADEEKMASYPEAFLSDMGKAVLYGSDKRIYYAELFEKAAKIYSNDNGKAYLCYFYAARLYEKAGIAYTDNALFQFDRAMNAATTDEQYDNALWYYLTTVQKISTRAAINSLQEFAPRWNDSSYFDDFLDTVAFNLLQNENFQGLYALYQFLEPYMSDASLSKYAYICARLSEENFLNIGYTDEHDKTQAQQKEFQKAYNAPNGSTYYRILAANKLNISSQKLLNALLQQKNGIKTESDKDFEVFLNEYIERNYPEYVYPIYMANSKLVSLKNATILSEALSQTHNPSVHNNYENNLYPESLRLASRAIYQSNENISTETMQLLYPRFYADYVTDIAQKYNLQEDILYALIRSESFFDNDIESWAGAVGLTQLIPSTAADIARKLKVSDYDLHDPKTNIEFGAFYLEELVPRVNDSMLHALFSYNAGITNVRRWIAAYPQFSTIPDIFLEVIPFSETREYGRKILSASTLYALLYYDKSLDEIIYAIMN